MGATSTANHTVNPTVPSQPPKATTNEAQKLKGGVFGILVGAAALLMMAL